MEYTKPHLRSLGSLAQLTLGQNGSSPDGGSLDNQNNHGSPSDNNGGQGT